MSFRTFYGDAKVLLLVFIAIVWFAHFFPVLRFDIILCVPLVGVLVRFRAHYSLKGTVKADAEHGLVEVRQQHERDAEERVRGYGHMLRRVYTIERWGGLYKSTVPNILFWFTTSFIWSIVPHVPLWRISDSLVSLLPSTFTSFISPFISTSSLRNAVEFLLFLPANIALLVLTCRAVTTDAHLPFFSRPIREACVTAMNALTAPAERARPVRALTSPRMRGVFICELLRGLYVAFVSEPLLNHITTDDGFVLRFLPTSTTPVVVSIASDVTHFAFLGICSVLLCPLDVVKVRLCILYPGALPEPDYERTIVTEGTLALIDECKEDRKDSEREEDEPLEDATITNLKKDNGMPFFSPSLKAFRLRPQPYMNLWHCIRTINVEEGPRVLLRAWWASWISLL